MFTVGELIKYKQPEILKALGYEVLEVPIWRPSLLGRAVGYIREELLKRIMQEPPKPGRGGTLPEEEFDPGRWPK